MPDGTIVLARVRIFATGAAGTMITGWGVPVPDAGIRSIPVLAIRPDFVRLFNSLQNDCDVDSLRREAILCMNAFAEIQRGPSALVNAILFGWLGIELHGDLAGDHDFEGRRPHAFHLLFLGAGARCSRSRISS